MTGLAALYGSPSSRFDPANYSASFSIVLAHPLQDTPGQKDSLLRDEQLKLRIHARRRARRQRDAVIRGR
jgi:hypothetical protein